MSRYHRTYRVSPNPGTGLLDYLDFIVSKNKPLYGHITVDVGDIYLSIGQPESNNTIERLIENAILQQTPYHSAIIMPLSDWLRDPNLIVNIPEPTPLNLNAWDDLCYRTYGVPTAQRNLRELSSARLDPSDVEPPPEFVRLNSTWTYDEEFARPIRETPVPRHRYYTVWMPTSSYSKNASCFVDKDLKIIRNAILRCLRYLAIPTPRRTNRSAELWRNNTQSLRQYGIVIALECRRRGIADTSLEKFRDGYVAGIHDKPLWVYWEALNDSHRNYLVLREYRRIAKKALSDNRSVTRRKSMISTYSCNGLPNPRDWTYCDVRCILDRWRIMRPINVYVSTAGWTDDPKENLRYPGDSEGC